MALQLRSRSSKTLQHPYISSFSSSSSNGGEDDKTSPFPSFSYLSSIKASLRQSSPSPPRPRNPNSPPAHPSPRPSNKYTLAEIRKNLSEFRRRSSPPPSPEGRDSSSTPSVSFQDLYKRNVIGQGNTDASSGIKFTFDSIRESLRKMGPPSPAAGDRRKAQGDSPPSSLSLSLLKESLKLKPPEDSSVSSDSLRTSLFGRESGEVNTNAHSQTAGGDFVKSYSHVELGEKLKKLRPPEAENKKKAWFSLGELNERLKKLREIEKEEVASSLGGTLGELRDCLVKIKDSQDANKKKNSSRLSL